MFPVYTDAVEMGIIGYAFDVAGFGGSYFLVSMSLLRDGLELSVFFWSFLWNFGSLNQVK